MKALQAMAALAAVAAPTAAGAQAPDAFCADLRRVVAAAGEDPPFESLPQFGSKRARKMFGFTVGCGVSDRPTRAFVCQEQLAPSEVTAERLIAAAASCLPGAVRLPDREQRWGGRTLRLRAGDIVISAAEWAHMTRGGRQCSFAVERIEGQER